jgi:hypothetical protein
MARKPSRKASVGPVRISVALDGETHVRLRALVLVRSSSIQDLVSGWIERETASVRLPSVGGGSSQYDDPAGDAA